MTKHRRRPTVRRVSVPLDQRAVDWINTKFNPFHEACYGRKAGASEILTFAIRVLAADFEHGDLKAHMIAWAQHLEEKHLMLDGPNVSKAKA